MAALNVRNVTLEQMAGWKIAAAAEGKSLRDWVIAQLGRKVVSQTGSPEDKLAVVEQLERRSRPKTVGHHPRCKCSLCAA